MSAGVAPRRTEFAQAGGCGRFRQLLPGIIENETVVPVGGLRQAEQRLQQPMHAGRPEQVLAAHHLRHALQGVVDHHREMIAGRRLLARQDDVAPGFRPGGDNAGLAVRAFAVLGPGQIARPRARPPPCRAAARKARRDRAAAPLVRRQPFRRAGIERRAVGIARPRRLQPPAAPPVWRSRRGFRNSDRPAPGPTASRAPRDSRRDARTAAAPAFPRRCRARRGPRRSRPRIPACSGPRRYPRCAAGTGRRPAAPDRNSAAPNKRGRDADSRSGSAQNGKTGGGIDLFRMGREWSL